MIFNGNSDSNCMKFCIFPSKHSFVLTNNVTAILTHRGVIKINNTIVLILGVWWYTLTMIQNISWFTTYDMVAIRYISNGHNIASGTVRYAETCDQEHRILVTTTIPMGDTKSCVFQTFFYTVKAKYTVVYMKVFVGYVLPVGI